jgi:hypothetical protein
MVRAARPRLLAARGAAKYPLPEHLRGRANDASQPLTQHRHEHGRVLIALVGGQLHAVDKNGKRITTYDWQSGKAYWLDADPPGQTHADVNETSKPIEVIVVELQKDR